MNKYFTCHCAYLKAIKMYQILIKNFVQPFYYIFSINTHLSTKYIRNYNIQISEYGRYLCISIVVTLESILDNEMGENVLLQNCFSNMLLPPVQSIPFPLAKEVTNNLMNVNFTLHFLIFVSSGTYRAVVMKPQD